VESAGLIGTGHSWQDGKVTTLAPLPNPSLTFMVSPATCLNGGFVAVSVS
jgi:hypothetical protein